MAFTVRAMYDFKAEANSTELSIYAQEILTVHRTDIGEGWWEGSNALGQTGIFPENYVEIMEGNAPPPTVLSSIPPKPLLETQLTESGDEWSEAYSASPCGDEDAWNRELCWNEFHLNSTNGNHHEIQQQPLINSSDSLAGSSGSIGGVNKINLNLFSPYARAGGDNYLLGQTTLNIPENEQLEINQYDNVLHWLPPSSDRYTVMVTSPKKESKFKGFKSFMTYQLTPSFNNIQISRRYKHFDWLHNRLAEKYCLIPVPTLPEKQLAGRFDEQFVENRRAQLQEFVDWICRHPILSRCKVWKHFLTCTDERMWKLGKREAENDKIMGLNSCLAIKAPVATLTSSYVDMQTEGYLNYVQQMENVVRTLAVNCADQARKYTTMYNNEYQILGASFHAFGSAVALDDGAELVTKQLVAISKELGNAYIDIGKYFGEQPNKDWNHLLYKLHVHRGIFTAMPNVLSIHKEVRTKAKECDKLVTENKIDFNQMEVIKRRADVASYAVLAEMNYIRTEREPQLKVVFDNHLKEQITFYKNIVARLVAASDRVNEIS